MTSLESEYKHLYGAPVKELVEINFACVVFLPYPMRQPNLCIQHTKPSRSLLMVLRIFKWLLKFEESNQPFRLTQRQPYTRPVAFDNHARWFTPSAQLTKNSIFFTLACTAGSFMRPV